MEKSTEPHHNLEAERSVLGAALLDSEALAKAETILTEEDFASPAHTKIFAAMRAVARRGETVDILILCESLKETGALQAVGGAQYLGEITDHTVTTAHVEQHARLVARLATTRRQRASYHRAIHEIDQGADPIEVQRRVAAVELNPHGTHRARRIGEMLSVLAPVSMWARAPLRREPLGLLRRSQLGLAIVWSSEGLASRPKCFRVRRGGSPSDRRVAYFATGACTPRSSRSSTIAPLAYARPFPRRGGM